MSWMIRKLAFGLAASLLLQALTSGVAVAAERGDELVRRELERFLRDRAASREVVIEIPVLEGFAVESDQAVDGLRTEIETRAEEPFSGRIAVTVELLDGERLLHRGVISTYLRVDEQVFVPVRNLRRGDVLEEKDLRRVARDGNRLPADVVRDREQLLGHRMTRGLPANQPLRASHVEPVPLVGRGDRVTLVLESGPMSISGIGRAVEAGAAGDWIRVLNLDSRREISGRVARDGRVHVAF